jgi:hypothetical protein
MTDPGGEEEVTTAERSKENWRRDGDISGWMMQLESECQWVQKKSGVNWERVHMRKIGVAGGRGGAFL